MIVVRLTADVPGKVSFTTQLRGERNQTHSNYATDYFQMDGLGRDGLIVRGKSADYLGARGQLRYVSRLKAVPRGGEMTMDDDRLIIRGADEVTLLLAAATNLVSYKDVSGDPDARDALSYDRGRSWLHLNTMPLGQFYSVAVDLAEPDNIYGGTQDDAALFGPSTSPMNRFRLPASVRETKAEELTPGRPDIRVPNDRPSKTIPAADSQSPRGAPRQRTMRT